MSFRDDLWWGTKGVWKYEERGGKEGLVGQVERPRR